MVAGGRSASVIIHSISQPAELDFNAVLFVIHRETENYLARLARAASEGRAVDEANNFLRWLQFSGICRLLENYSFINEKFVTLRAKASELQEICKPHLQGRNIKEHPSQARIDELHDKVDSLVAIFAKSAKQVVEVESMPAKMIGQGVTQ